MGGVVVLLAAGAILGCQGASEEPPEEPVTPVAVAVEANGSLETVAPSRDPAPQLDLEPSVAPPDAREQSDDAVAATDTEPAEQERLLAAQELLDRWFVIRGRPTLVEEPHVCSSSDYVITGFYTFERRTERLFWMIEYPSIEAAERAWHRETDGTSTPQNACFDVASVYQREANLVVEVPPTTIDSQLILFILETLPHLEPVGDPWRYLDLAEAIEQAGLIWGGYGDNLSSCLAPFRADFDDLTRAEFFDRGRGVYPSVVGSEAVREGGSGLMFELFLYSSSEARANQWEVAADGTARSDACGYDDDAIEAPGFGVVGAANIVVVTRDADHPAWPRLVAVLDELGGRTE